MNIVIDASVAIEFLLRTPAGRRLEPQLENAPLFAPELLDAEILAVVRRLVLGGRLDAKRASEDVNNLFD